MPRPHAPSPLTAHLGYWLRLVSNHVSHAFAMKVEAEGVTVAEWVVLRELFGVKQVNPSQLADALGMTRGTISKLVDRLVTKRLITRSVSRDDARFQSVALTARGRKLVPLLARLADQNDQSFFGHLSADARAELFITLQSLARRRDMTGVPLQ